MTYNILFGFKDKEFETSVVNILKKDGHIVNFTERDTKESIKGYLSEHKEFNVAVIRENMGAESYSAADFAELTDYRDIKIVPLLESQDKGTEYMDVLYAAGILDALYFGKKGISPNAIAAIILHPRYRKKARGYYGISGNKVALDVLTYDKIVMYHTRLSDPNRGINLIDRYLSIVSELSAKQVATFTKALPMQTRNELATYDEFYYVLDELKKQGISIKVNKPQYTKRGLTDEQYRRALLGELKEEHKSLEQSSDNRKIEAVDSSNQDAGEANPFEGVDNALEMYAENPAKSKLSTKKETEPNIRKPVKTSSTKDIPKDKAEEKRAKKKSKVQWKYVLVTFLICVILLAIWYMIMTIVGF